MTLSTCRMQMRIQNGEVPQQLGKYVFEGKEVDLDYLVNDISSPLSNWKRAKIQKMRRKGVQTLKYNANGSSLVVCNQELFPFDMFHYPDDHETTVCKKLYGDLSPSVQRKMLNAVKMTPIPLAGALHTSKMADIDVHSHVLWCAHKPGTKKTACTIPFIEGIIEFACCNCLKKFMTNDEQSFVFQQVYGTVRFYNKQQQLVFATRMTLPMCSGECLQTFEMALKTKGSLDILK